MSIGRKILTALLGLSLLVITLLFAVSYYGFFDIRTSFQKENEAAIGELYKKNVAEITDSSSRLAVSLANYNAQTINIDFERIMGELMTVKGDVETLYRNGGTNSYKPISRYEEYIISQAANPSKAEVRRTLKTLSAATPMFDNILSIEPKISLAYLVLENGMVISSTDTFYAAVEKADMRTRDWYKDTVAAKDLHWSELYSGTDKRSYVTCSVPIYDQNKSLVGVLAFDLRVSEISEKVLNVENSSFVASFVLSAQGSVLLSSEDVEKTKEEPYFKKLDGNIDYKTAASGYYADDSSIIGYARIESTDWLLVTVLDYDLMMAPVQSVAQSVSDTGVKMEQVITGTIQRFLLIFSVVIAVLLFLVLITATRLSKSITKPIAVLTDGAKKIGNGELDYRFEDTNKDTDEIGMLAATFNTMTVRLKEYIEEIASAAAERQRIESELDVARSIQLGMLPGKLVCPGYDIAGTMLPAKEVGGDFYDFFPVGDDKLCFTVADVSGKGMGAALFMTIAKIVIKTAAQNGLTVDELLGVANDLLCQENPAQLFVTAFVGIMDIKTGEVFYACAGHNPPVLCHTDGSAEFIPIKHKLPLAAMEGIRYPVMNLKLLKGETLVLYTDGVTEATDAENELFGDARLLATVKDLNALTCFEAIGNLKSNVDVFIAGAPQFDDITIVAIKKTGGEKTDV